MPPRAHYSVTVVAEFIRNPVGCARACASVGGQLKAEIEDLQMENKRLVGQMVAFNDREVRAPW